MSAAARARRLDEKASITIFEKVKMFFASQSCNTLIKSWQGPDPSFANCGMPYFLGGEIKDRKALSVQTPTSLKNRLELDVRVKSGRLFRNATMKFTHSSL